MSRKTSSTDDTQTIRFTFDEETIETAIQNILNNLGRCIFTWTKNPLELEAKTKLQKKGLTSSEVKDLMVAERKRIEKRLSKDPRLTTKGIREMLNIYSEGIKENSINDNTIQDLSYTLLLETNKESRIGDATKLTFIFTAIAELEKKQSRIITAWKAIAKAQYYYGLLTGLDDPNTYLSNQRASQGGEARSLKLMQQKLPQQIMLDLLYKMVPQNKWRNFPAAADAIFDQLIEKLQTEAANFTQNEIDLKADLLNLIAEHKDTFINS